ncbi:MAG: hypothetical protein AAFR87_04415 [Bacteroidota bacterium]
MEILQSIFFPLIERWQLRNHQGQSRPSNFSHPKRNDAFYKKLEAALLPYFKEKSFEKIRKRKFIKEEKGLIHFYELGLSKKCNSLVIDFGWIDPAKHSIEKLKRKHTFSSFARKHNRLSPEFWEYDYQYPVRKSDDRDEKIISEIKALLESGFHQKFWEEV